MFSHLWLFRIRVHGYLYIGSGFKMVVLRTCGSNVCEIADFSDVRFRHSMIKSSMKSLTCFTVSVSHLGPKCSTPLQRPFVSPPSHPNLSGCYKYIFANHLKNLWLDKAGKVLDGLATTEVHLYTMMLNEHGQDRLEWMMPWNCSIKCLWEIPSPGIQWLRGVYSAGICLLPGSYLRECLREMLLLVRQWLMGICSWENGGGKEVVLWDASEGCGAWNLMIHWYFWSGRVENAVKMFEEMPQRNVIS